MRLLSMSWLSAPAICRGTTAVAVAVTLLTAVTPSAQAQDAGKVLKAMTDYVTSQKIISATYDTDIEVITDALQKIQFASSGQMLMNRPDMTPRLALSASAD